VIGGNIVGGPGPKSGWGPDGQGSIKAEEQLMEKGTKIVTYVCGGSALLALIFIGVMYFKFYKTIYVSIPERYEIASDAIKEALEIEKPATGFGRTSTPTLQRSFAGALRAAQAGAQPNVQEAAASLSLLQRAERDRQRTLAEASAFT
jgi:hypothetical protein